MGADEVAVEAALQWGLMRAFQAALQWGAEEYLFSLLFSGA